MADFLFLKITGFRRRGRGMSAEMVPVEWRVHVQRLPTGVADGWPYLKKHKNVFRAGRYVLRIRNEYTTNKVRRIA